MDRSGQHLLEVLTRSAAPTLVACVAAVVALCGCATLVAPVTFDTEADSDDADAVLTVDPVEGRPDGLLLRLSAAAVSKDASQLQLLRARGDRAAVVHREIALDDRTRNALTVDGIEYLERGVDESSERLRYQLRLLSKGSSEPIATSDVTTVRWRQPPERPTDVEAVSHLTGSVELRWNAPPGTGALVFRRNVTRRGSSLHRFAEVSTSSSGVFVDRRASPGDVYAYRIALADLSGLFAQYGPPSEPVYVMAVEEHGTRLSTQHQ